ncbi:MAG: tRNA (adenosine(37)-N6)-threonylcarbamoyltransferase complex dimerization subunit type 1 TsaB [Thermodesulfobacteria bacterium]|nr:tRNA (adenosine(37)-N6)-threonylcarbamoyltransferase complex dimerization subunit type 1 TsaB [Thermodesulfobacteriota bacterium]
MGEETLILSLETATPCGGVAIVGQEVKGELLLASAETHSRRLLAGADYLLRRLGLGLKDLSGIAVSIGPGSFTGLRIGLATAKGLHLATGLPLLGVGTLEALALNASLSPHPVCPVLDARRNQLYTAIYRFENGKAVEVLPPSLLSPERLLEHVQGPTVFLGDGLKPFGELLAASLGDDFLTVPENLNHPRPANVGVLARRRLLRGETDDPYRLLPLYLRPSEAELKRRS